MFTVDKMFEKNLQICILIHFHLRYGKTKSNIFVIISSLYFVLMIIKYKYSNFTKSSCIEQ